ncbi:MAG: response regulator [Acidobacteriota bacterium]|nr:response regulator [Acidobacteriota bacterium]
MNSNNNRQSTVMILNDVPSQRRLMTSALEKDGWRVVPCASAEQAFEVLQSEEPIDLILTELCIPGTQGWQLCCLLRSAEYAALRNIPILAVSAIFSGSDAHQLAAELGADSFLGSPYTPAMLSERARTLMQERPAKRSRPVLIVEPDGTQAMALAEAFERHGYEVHHATTSQQARQQVQHVNPVVIVLAHPLPDLSTEDLLIELKQSAHEAVIMMTAGETDPAQPLLWTQQGADGCLRNPFDPEYLIELSRKARSARLLMRINERLAEQILKLRAMIENQDEGIAIVNPDEVVTFSNPASDAIFGVALGTLVGRHLSEFTDAEQMEIIRSQTERRRRGEHSRYELDIIQPGGCKRRLLVTATPQYDDAGQFSGTLGIVRDITDQRKMEDELLKMQKLESLSILAGGIAHDFNNYLVAILGNISLAKLALSPEDEAYQRLGAAENAASRAKDLTQQLLSFSKGGAPIKRAASLAAILQQTAEFALRGSNVRLDLAVADDLWTAEFDHGQISQLITNLVINADQAMPHGGTIQIKAENVTLDHRHTLPLSGRHYVKLTVRDHGVGIPEEYLDKIFDPYFTTKQTGNGLGLATCYSIVKKHDGHITVESHPGVGTTFTVYLPALPHQQLPPDPPAQPQHPSRRGKILVMDDDEIIRDVTAHVLRRLNYQAEFAQDGLQAIEIYQRARQEGEPFDAVILDLTVPHGLGGKETIQRLLQVDPQVNAIVSTGYSNDPVVADFEKFGFKGCVIKPYKMHELHSLLQQLINQSPATQTTESIPSGNR